jgi:hypothetical protein
MGKWEAIGGAVCFVAFFYFMSNGVSSDAQRQKEETARIVSCNKLKEAAIAAKAPEPICAH